MRERILVVEDEAIVLLDLKTRLKALGYAIAGESSSGQDAISAATETLPDIVLMDIGLKGDVDGIAAADRIHAALDIPIIYLTANSDINTLERAKITGPYGFVLKPFDERELRITIEMALHKHKFETGLNDARRRLEATLNSIGDAIIATDASARIAFANPAAEALIGLKPADAIGRDISEVLDIAHGGDGKLLPGHDDRRSLNGPAVLVRCDGTEVQLDSSVWPIKGDDGEAIGVVFVLRDVGEKRRSE